MTRAGASGASLTEGGCEWGKCELLLRLENAFSFGLRRLRTFLNELLLRLESEGGRAALLAARRQETGESNPDRPARCG